MRDKKKISIILLERDKTALERMAQSEGEKTSVLIRRLIRQELIRNGYLSQPTIWTPEKRNGS